MVSRARAACTGSVERRTVVEAEGLLHPPAAKIALVRRILLDVGSRTLLCNILRFEMFQGIIGQSFGLAAGPLIAAIGGRNLRHVLSHFDSPNKDFGINSAVT